jgi:hypothetical protein
MGRAGLSAAEKRVLLAELLRKKAAENTAKAERLVSTGWDVLLTSRRSSRVTRFTDMLFPTWRAVWIENQRWTLAKVVRCIGSAIGSQE